MIPLKPEYDPEISQFLEEFEAEKQLASSDTKLKCLHQHDLELCDENLLQIKKVMVKG